jgi:hypothetical protein
MLAPMNRVGGAPLFLIALLSWLFATTTECHAQTPEEDTPPASPSPSPSPSIEPAQTVPPPQVYAPTAAAAPPGPAYPVPSSSEVDTRARQTLARDYLIIGDEGHNRLPEGAPFRGIQHQALTPEEFYAIVERDDLAAMRSVRLRVRNSLGIAGALSEALALVLVAMPSHVKPTYGCVDGTEGAGCRRIGVEANAPRDYYLSSGFFAVGGLGAILTAILLGTDPLGDDARRDMADQYNRKRERQLGLPPHTVPRMRPNVSLRVAPEIGSGFAALTVGGRF